MLNGHHHAIINRQSPGDCFFCPSMGKIPRLPVGQLTFLLDHFLSPCLRILIAGVLALLHLRIINLTMDIIHFQQNRISKNGSGRCWKPTLTSKPSRWLRRRFRHEPLLNRKQMAAILGISMVTLHAWMNRGLPHHKQGGKVYFLRSNVIEFVTENRSSTAGGLRKGRLVKKEPLKKAG